MPRTKHLSDGDLVACEDGKLEEARRARIEAHLASCPVCRDRLTRFREVTRLLQERYPLVDDPAARAEIMERIRAEREKQA